MIPIYQQEEFEIEKELVGVFKKLFYSFEISILKKNIFNKIAL